MYKLDTVENDVHELHSQFSKFRMNNADMLSQRNAAIEEKFVAYAAAVHGSSSLRVDPVDETSTHVFSTLAGVIVQSEQTRFARTVFRATRGNAFTEFYPIPVEADSGIVLKSVFLIYYQGGAGSAMSDKITRITSSFNANMYAWPRSAREANEQISQCEQMIEDKRAALVAFEKFITDETLFLFKVVREGGNSLVEEWRMFCAKEKAIFACLNLFEGEITLRADCWFPVEEEFAIRELLRGVDNTLNATLLVGHSGGGYAAHHGAPTYIKTNEVTESFQQIVDTYGVPRYKEVNPGLFATVTFPFLFGVMFGDVGHGLMLMMIGVWAILLNKRGRVLPHVAGLVTHRYMITAMGFFAVYAGLIYSEFFAIGLNLFGSRWSCPADNTDCVPLYSTTNNGTGPYPFGIDPAWDVATNQLLFVNSMKMKLSVLFGVVQMLLGIGLKFSNSFFFNNYLDLIFECIPQLLFMVAFFGYMDWMIMYKWVYGNESSPGLIDTMITMGLTGGGVRDGAQLYAGQAGVQSVLFKIILWSIPLMLIPKPLFLYFQNRHSTNATGETEDRIGLVDRAQQNSVVVSSTGGPHNSNTHEESFEIGEVVIHQAIETIEYVLGTISHTASYLRLWALSLAHQQLSLVFLQKTLYSAMSSDWPMFFNAIPIYIGFAMFLGVTTGILLGMDVMECFLHTLRLHWVEFQSKFYKADGVKFHPFKHVDALASKSE